MVIRLLLLLLLIHIEIPAVDRVQVIGAVRFFIKFFKEKRRIKSEREKETYPGTSCFLFLIAEDS